MMKHRALFLGLGLVALLSLSAREVNAAPMTLVVELNGNVVYSINGPTTGSSANQAVTANTTNLNNAMGTSGYVWTGLQGASNFPGSTIPNVGGYVSTSGNVSFQGGTGGTLTIFVYEGGFTTPASGTGNSLKSSAGATISGADSSATTVETGKFNDSATPTPLTVSAPPLSFTGTDSDAHSGNSSASLPPWVGTFTLTNMTTIHLTKPGASNSNDVFTATTSVLPGMVVPEPASLVMMVTGMPLPLVVMGLLRRRRAAA